MELGHQGGAIIHFEQGARVSAPGGESGGNPQVVGGLHVELHQGAGRLAGDEGGIIGITGRTAHRGENHRRLLPGSPVDRPPKGERLNPSRVARTRVHRNRLIGLRDDRAVAKGGKSRAQVGGKRGIGSARGSVLRGHRQDGPVRHAIEIKPRIQIVIPREPLGPERDLVSLAIRDAAAVGISRLEVVVQSFSAAGGHEVEDVVGWAVGVHVDEAVAVIAQDAPGRQPGLKGAILQQLDWGSPRRFNHLQVVEETLARIQKTKLEFIPQGRAEDIGGDGEVRVITPA